MYGWPSTSWIYRSLSDSERHGRRALRLNLGVWGLYLNLTSLEHGFDEGGRQTQPLPARITGDLAALYNLLSRSGGRREVTRCCTTCWRRKPVERGDILRVLRAHPDNCIRAFHRDRLLIRHYGGLVPDEIVLDYVMFVKV